MALTACACITPSDLWQRLQLPAAADLKADGSSVGILTVHLYRGVRPVPAPTAVARMPSTPSLVVTYMKWLPKVLPVCVKHETLYQGSPRVEAAM